MKTYKPVIGLEIHVELKTMSKMFCQCFGNYFGKHPNTHVCPVCLGLPGALPVPNKKAIEWTILIGKALGCAINKVSKFDRKHYFYPDLPKGFQISQYDEPIAVKGYLSISDKSENGKRINLKTENRNSDLSFQSSDLSKKTFRISRVHLEEDTGKLIHSGTETLIDFNRSGVPLVEIVTEPDFDNSDDVKRFLEELQVIIRYLGVSDADMEKGTMRLEPNISVREILNSKFEVPNKNQSHPELVSGSKLKQMLKQVQHDIVLPKYKVEVKNINSFRFVKQAIDYEIKRQIEILETGKLPIQETRGFDEKKQATYSQRSKEEAHDYRYFPEPDIPPMTFSNEYIKKIKVPELPSAKLERYISDFKINQHTAFQLTRSIKLSDFFEKVISNVKISSFVPRLSLGTSTDKQNLEQSVANFIINRKISSNLTIEQFSNKVIELLQPKETDEGELNTSINRTIEANPKVVNDYKSGKENAIMFLVGQVMRELKGRVNAKDVINKIKEKLTNNH